MPIFILSCERSGSTLLRVALNSHPEIAAPGELGLGELCHRLVLVLSRTVGQQGAEPVPVVPVWWQTQGESLSPAVQDILSSTRKLVDSIMNPFTEAAGKRVWCAKAPSNLPFANLLRLTYPDARFICLYRQGLDVAQSCLEVSQHGFMKELIPYLNTSPGDTVLAMLRSWLDKTAKLLDFEQNFPQICHRVRYEDLVTSPTEELSRLCDFLGIKQEEDLTNLVFRTRHLRGGGDPKIWNTDHIHADRIGCGSKLPVSHLSPVLKDKIDGLLRKLDYQEIFHAKS